MSINVNGTAALHRMPLAVRLVKARQFLDKHVVLVHSRLRLTGQRTEHRGRVIAVAVVDGGITKDVIVLDVGGVQMGYPLAQVRSLTEVSILPAWEPGVL
jgi:hypothetical protein